MSDPNRPLHRIDLMHKGELTTSWITGLDAALAEIETDITTLEGSTHDPVTVGTGLDVTGQLVELDLSEVAAGGELGGTMDAPTVDALHSGSTHAATLSTAEGYTDSAIASEVTRANAAYDAAGAAAAAQAASQPLDGDLTAIAALTTTPFGRGLLDDADAAAGRTSLGLGTAATHATTDYDAAGAAAAALVAAEAYTDTAVAGYQPLDSDLTAFAGLAIAADKLPYGTGSHTLGLADLTAAGRALIDDANAAAQRTTLGLGTAAVAATTDFDAAGVAAAADLILVPSGSIMMYAGAAAPTSWLLCDGTSYLRATYAALFTAIGTTYGSVDGTHFNVPDLRQRFPLGKAASGTGAALGDTGGAIDHLHTGPSHTHSTPTHAHTLSAHTHTGPSHTHTTPTHAHTLSGHTHTGPSHTHSTPTHAHTLSAHTHTGPSHTHTGPSHTHTSAAHTHGVDHDHTGPSHSHNASSMGTGITQPGATGTATRPASNHTHAFTTTSDGTGHTSGALNGLGNPMVVTDSTTPGATGAEGTGATGAAGTGATAGPSSDTTDTSGSGTSGAAGTGASGAPSADTTDTSGSGTSGASGTAVTGAPSADTTDTSGSGTSGAAGTGNTGTNNPPYLVVNFIIKT